MSNHLYEIVIKVERGMGCDLPEKVKGAFVPCYVAAVDFKAAVRNGVIALERLNYVFKDISRKMREIPVTSWADYVAKVWPESAKGLPSQMELPDLVEKGAVFFGPFSCYEHSSEETK